MNFKIKSRVVALGRWAVLALVAACASVVSIPTAYAGEIAAPGWELTGHTYPTNLPPGGAGGFSIRVINIGAAASSGPVTVTDVLPPGVTAVQAGEEYGIEEHNFNLGSSLWACTGDGPGGAVAGAGVVRCVTTPGTSIAGGGGIPDHGAGDPMIGITVNVSSAVKDPEEVLNRITVAGGGTFSSASTSESVTISSNDPPFGFAGATAWFSNANGTLDTQAGSHPYEATFNFDLNNVINHEGFPSIHGGGRQEIRNLEFNLPPGFIGNPYSVPMCQWPKLTVEQCPPDSQIGVIQAEVLGAGFLAPGPAGTPVFNMVPPPGAPAEFGFQIFGINTVLVTKVRSGGDYGLTTHVNNIAQRDVLSSVLTLWSQPGDPSHSAWHPGAGVGGGEPLLTLPTSCEGPQAFSLSMTSWERPQDAPARASFLTHDSNGEAIGFTGCEDLSFGPTITAAPDTSNADTPAGLTVEVKPSLGGFLGKEGLGSSDIKETTVVLPPGVVVNPGQAAGLKACQPSESGIGTEDAPSCPLASRVGTDEITLPVLKSNLEGNVYVLQSEPPHLKLLIAASGEGVNVKLVGNVHLDEQTGQLTTTVTTGIEQFPNIPQAPVSDFKLSFSGGAQAALDTPTTCGTYTTTSDFTAWASPFVAEVSPTASFAIASGTNGAPCPPSPLPFTPAMIAGSSTDQAGGFTDFSLLLQAPDDQQRIAKLQFKVPQGLLGMISKVPLCGEPQAKDGACSSDSQIGHTVVASGPGPYPLVVPQPGQPPAAIYLTGPYEGAPYGLSIVVPVVVGPFTLETQIVRAKIEIDPLTAQITVTTDPMPQIIDGVPTDLRTVNAVIDRPGFMFNPTSCAPMSFSGTAFSAQGASAPIASPFQMGSCRSLLFKPDFKVSTSGRTSRANGASLDVKLVYPSTPQGANQASSQSNIRSVKVDLPKQLPSRLTTLQKACRAATFEADPAGCPAASRVGRVEAMTPVLPVPLTGPAYFVSYGGAKFPELVFVLQGYGVTVFVHAETFINKAGITSSTLHRVPDVPIASFELVLPKGRFSALAANGNLCKSTLRMPTAFTAQNGAVIHQSTPIGVTGCPKVKRPANKRTKRASKGKRG
jgi:uncharacterized repeat protein (TIGR01451 family)